jgi:uroporphyrinogen III methyltransferase/synthase
MLSIKVIARGSQLSQIQVEEVKKQLQKVAFEVQLLDSLGDKDKSISLMDNIPADFFTREIDNAILNGSADIAIHSAKDLPYPLPKGLELIALTKSKDKTDSLVTRNGKGLTKLPNGSVIGTSSEQRKRNILDLRNDLEIKSIRGTIEERIKQLDEKKYDAVIVATCALERLKLKSRITEKLSFSTHPLQGNLAVVAKKGNLALKELFSSIDIRHSFGKVFIAGAGPGDPEYITVKAKRALRKADTIFYDNLINPILLKESAADKIYVGKRKGEHAYAQEDINEMMYRHAIQGKTVLRLKGGDPMIFGRGGEEFDYLRSRMLDVEIIPGISAAVAASATRALPLTYRNKSASVSFLTGFPEDKTKFPDTDTLVYYMGASNAHTIALKVIESGKSPNTPVAIVRNASLQDESIQFATLDSVAKKRVVAESPSVFVIGEIATDNNYSSNNNHQANILFTGTDASKYKHLGNIIHTPLIDIKPIYYNKCEFDQIADQEFDFVVFTSRYSVKYFMRILLNANYDARWFVNKKIISVGATTSKSLRAHFIQPNEQMELESSTGIINWFKKQKINGKKIFIPRSNKGLNYLPDELTALGNAVHLMHVYKNVMPANVQEVDLQTIKAVVFTSPSTVANFLTIYNEIPKHIKIISRGEQTTIYLNERNYVVANQTQLKELKHA